MQDTADRAAAPSSLGILTYSLMLWPLSIAQLSLNFLAPYYAPSFGMSLAVIGMILTIGRSLDVIADVGVAWLSDRTRSRWGRRKPWVVVGLILYIPATLLLFIPPATVSVARFAGTTMLFFLSWTMAFIPYLAQGTELSPAYTVKNRINVVQSAVMLVALLSAFTVPLLLIDPKASAVRAAIAHAMQGLMPGSWEAFLLAPPPAGAAYYGHSMLIISILSLLPLLVTLPIYMFRVREPKLPKTVAHGSPLAALRNPVFLRFALGYILIMAAYMGRSGLLPFILIFALKLPNTYLFFMMLMFVSSLLITPIWSRLLQRFERMTCIIAAALIEAVGLGTLFLIPANSTVLTAIAFIIMGLPGQTLLMVPYLIAADASDYSLWKTGSDSRAIHVSLCSLIVKLGAVFAGLWVWLAGLVGFNPTQAVQTPQILMLIKLIGLGIPVALLLIGTAIVAGFPLDRRRHGVIQKRLARIAMVEPV